MKNVIESIYSTVKQMEDKIHDLEDRNFELRAEKKNEWRVKKVNVIYEIPSKEQMYE